MLRSIHIILCFSAFMFQIPAQNTTINYLESTNDFANPERGFYRYSATRASNYTLLNQATLEGFRQLHTPHTGTPAYQIYSTLIFRYFFLDDFKTSNISASFLANMQTDFNTARAAGVKIIVRFAYTNEVDGSTCASWICPPYGDASKSWVLTHINQLSSVLQANADVIAMVQMGFIGVWGENYYTDYFGDASQSPYKLTNTNWQDRIDVLNALLDAVPSDRMVQVRYPQKKQRMIYGIAAPTNSAALTLAEAYNGSDKARIGFHNDCLLASWTDFGTYNDYGNDLSGSTGDTTNLKPYFAADSKFVAVGGETCSGYDPFDNCESTGATARADEELRRLHYSYLNAEYNFPAVNADWMGICMEDIQKNLGYRFVLSEGTFSNEAQPNQTISINLTLANKGYAAPYNPRNVELILKNRTNGIIWKASLTADPRTWFRESGMININQQLCIPSNMPSGIYDLFLNLPDPHTSIANNPNYSIRLANQLPNMTDIWESSTGYNDLGHQIIINNSAANPTCSGQTSFTTNAILPLELLSFSTVSLESAIQLHWQTKNEIDHQGFWIQRSTDAARFNDLQWIDSQGSHSTIMNYEWQDKNVLPNQLYYYRLKQLDLDGQTSFTHLASGILEKPDLLNEIHIYPNPASENLTIQFGTAVVHTVYLNIFNAQGELLERRTLTHQNHNLPIPQALPASLYYFKFEMNGATIWKKVVIQ